MSDAPPAPPPAAALDLALERPPTPVAGRSAEATRRRRRRGRARQAFLVGADVVGLLLPLALLGALDRLPEGGPPTTLVVLSVFGVTFHLYGLYVRHPRTIAASTLNELPQMLHATLLAALVAGGTMHLLSSNGLGHTLVAMVLAGLVVVPATRSIARRLMTRILGPDRVLLVGTGTVTASVARALDERADIRVVGHLDLPASWRREARSNELDPHFDPGLALRERITDERVDRVLLSTRDLGGTSVAEFLLWSRGVDVSVTVLPEHFDVVGVGASIDHLSGATMVSLQPPGLSTTARLVKRGLDVVGATAGLVLLAPLLLAVAIAVRLDSPGPVLFRQERVGRDGRRFRLVKFRSMVDGADAMLEELMARSSDPNWLQLDDDPRLTRVGRRLRRTSIDELPQLWNVLRGDMSLVGPRPLSVRDDARVGEWARGRLNLTPGLTGSWQVLGRKAVPFEEMVKLDHLYVTNWSLWGDIKLLLQTLPAVLRGRGAR